MKATQCLVERIFFFKPSFFFSINVFYCHFLCICRHNYFFSSLVLFSLRFRFRIGSGLTPRSTGSPWVYCVYPYFNDSTLYTRLLRIWPVGLYDLLQFPSVLIMVVLSTELWCQQWPHIHLECALMFLFRHCTVYTDQRTWCLVCVGGHPLCSSLSGNLLEYWLIFYWGISLLREHSRIPW